MVPGSRCLFTRVLAQRAQRGGRAPLLPEGVQPVAAAPAGPEVDDTAPTPTDAQLVAESRGVQPDPDRILDWDELGSKSFNLLDATRAVLRIRTNIILIVASACGYFYLSGIETFAAVRLHIDWKALGIDSANAQLTAPEIRTLLSYAEDIVD